MLEWICLAYLLKYLSDRWDKRVRWYKPPKETSLTRKVR